MLYEKKEDVSNLQAMLNEKKEDVTRLEELIEKNERRRLETKKFTSKKFWREKKVS